jgi:hypothetical protein
MNIEALYGICVALHQITSRKNELSIRSVSCPDGAALGLAAGRGNTVMVKFLLFKRGMVIGGPMDGSLMPTLI